MGWPESNSSEVLKLYEHYLPPVEDFIAQAERRYETVLIFCSNGQNRALSIVIAYLTKRYYWSFSKTFEFLTSKKDHFEIKKTYYKNLKMLIEQFEENNRVSSNWDFQFCSAIQLHEEEMILTNTFLNSKKRDLKLHSRSRSSKRLTQNHSFRNLANIPISRRSVSGSTKPENPKRVVWADKINSVETRSVKSVGKSKMKVSANENCIRPLSANGKTNPRTLFIKTEVDDSQLSDDGISISLKADRKTIEMAAKTGSFKSNLTNLDKNETERMSKNGKVSDNGSGFKQRVFKEPKSAQMNNNLIYKNRMGKEIFSDEPKFVLKSQMEIGSDPAQMQTVDVRASNTSEDFYKKGLRDLHKKIFSKKSDPVISDSSRQKNSYSKVSTHVQEESIKQIPEEYEAFGLPSNLSFTQNPSTVLPEIQTKSILDQRASLLNTASNPFNCRPTLNKTSEQIDKSNFVSKAKQLPSCQQLDSTDGNHILTQISRIKIQKRKALETFFKPQETEETQKDKKLELLNKLKRLSSEKLVKISSNYSNKDLVSGNSINPDNKNSAVDINEGNTNIGNFKRPNSAPLKDDQKERLVQKNLLFNSKSIFSKGVKVPVDLNQPLQFFISKVQGSIPREGRQNPPFNKRQIDKS